MITKLKPLYEVVLNEEGDTHYYSIQGMDTWYKGVTNTLNVISKFHLYKWCSKMTAEYMAKMIEKILSVEKGHLMFDKDINPSFMDLFIRRAKKQPNIIRDKASLDGTNSHKVLNGYIETGVLDVFDKYAESFKIWKEQEPLKIIQGDTKVFSIKHRYGGSIDLLLQDENGKYVIGDLKTGKSLYSTHKYQIAAYAQAFQETYGLDYLPEGIILHPRIVYNKSIMERYEVNDMRHGLNQFLLAKSLSEGLDAVDFTNKLVFKGE